MQGYFPEECIQAPKCRTGKIGLALDKTLDRPSEWHCFYTKGSKVGECGDQETDFQHFGYTWVHGNLIYYGGGKGLKPTYGFDFLSNKFYVDEDHDPPRFYVKEKK